jgi:uncharacterized UBP type Zn finger protein
MLDLINHITGAKQSSTGTGNNSTAQSVSTQSKKKTDNANENKGRLRYELIHTIYHEGSGMNAGHYTAGINVAPTID